MTYDLTGRVAAVNTVPLGGTLAEEAPAGATVLLVEDTADFDPDGGALLLGGAEVVTYTSADDESGEVILAAPTAALWEIDTRVDVWDAATSAPVSRRSRRSSSKASSRPATRSSRPSTTP
ncbi:hypothetical protein [Promicromonospora kroppenstedtii]|uniref:hypothetical protein n=1 Tax=Promicromonospora kroppenstedtii TaxID=440482 RepID=UPI0004BC7BCE|nr:hypothetical protein [Promicromonospora kroppenstedtii]